MSINIKFEYRINKAIIIRWKKIQKREWRCKHNISPKYQTSSGNIIDCTASYTLFQLHYFNENALSKMVTKSIELPEVSCDIRLNMNIMIAIKVNTACDKCALLANFEKYGKSRHHNLLNSKLYLILHASRIYIFIKLLSSLLMYTMIRH